jgi:hypothetical protein
MAWSETHNTPIEETGVLWLKAATRTTSNKDGKIQGKGWELRSYGNIASSFIMFKNIYEIYKLENPDSKPHTEILPISIKITE